MVVGQPIAVWLLIEKKERSCKNVKDEGKSKQVHMSVSRKCMHVGLKPELFVCFVNYFVYYKCNQISVTVKN